MNTRPDIEVYSPDHSLQLVVEARRTTGASREWAARFRRNLLAHAAVPNAPFFLLAFPATLYLWRNGAGLDSPPDYEAPASDVLREYLGAWAATTEDVGEESLQIALGAWLRDLTQAFREPRSHSAADQMLVASGLYDAIQHGSIEFESSSIGR